MHKQVSLGKILVLALAFGMVCLLDEPAETALCKRPALATLVVSAVPA